MEKFIVKPLYLLANKHMEVFLNKISISNRLYIVSGKLSVGKSAFVFKLLNHAANTNKFHCPILFVNFDKTINYWKDQLKSENIKNVTFKALSLQKYNALNNHFHKEMTEGNYQLLIIDGIYHFKEYEDKGNRERLLLELMDLSAAVKIPVILTERNSKPKLLPKNVLHSHRAILPETWHLERPEYYGGEIEKGDTRIYVY